MTYQDPYLIEQTAKRWKAMQLIGGAAVLLSFPGCMVAQIGRASCMERV